MDNYSHGLNSQGQIIASFGNASVGSAISTHEKVIASLIEIRKLEEERGRNPSEVYSLGNCGELYFLLHVALSGAAQVKAFGMGRFFGSPQHVIIGVDNRFYTINGEEKGPFHEEYAPEKLMRNINNYESNRVLGFFGSGKPENAALKAELKAKDMEYFRQNYFHMEKFGRIL